VDYVQSVHFKPELSWARHLNKATPHRTKFRRIFVIRSLQTIDPRRAPTSSNCYPPAKQIGEHKKRVLVREANRGSLTPVNVSWIIKHGTERDYLLNRLERDYPELVEVGRSAYGFRYADRGGA
jgi:hypothetical protein